jgi:hypothetical protein
MNNAYTTSTRPIQRAILNIYIDLLKNNFKVRFSSKDKKLYSFYLDKKSSEYGQTSRWVHIHIDPFL